MQSGLIGVSADNADLDRCLEAIKRLTSSIQDVGDRVTSLEQAIKRNPISRTPKKGTIESQVYNYVPTAAIDSTYLERNDPHTLSGITSAIMANGGLTGEEYDQTGAKVKTALENLYLHTRIRRIPIAIRSIDKNGVVREKHDWGYWKDG